MAEYPTSQPETIEPRRPATSGKVAREKVEEVKEEAFTRGKGMIEGQKRTVSETAHRIAAALETVASDLEYDQPQFASIFRDGAEALDRFSRNLRERNTESLLRQAQDFARRQPAVVLGGTIAVGFLLSRLLKSSPQGEAEYTEYGEFSGQGFSQADPYATSGSEGFSTAPLEKEGKTYGSE